jgi:hypothetical protein
VRVERHLHRVDAPAAHRRLQLAERARVVVGGADQADAPDGPLALDPRQPLAPGHEVVDLEQVDPPAEPRELAGVVLLRERLRRRPGLRRHERP